MKEVLKNKYVSSITLIIIGMVFGGLLISLFSQGQSQNCPDALRYLNPELDCVALDEAAPKISNLQDKLEILIKGYQNNNKISRAGVFVRDLVTSRFAGVNENDVFYLASLLKLPLIVGGYKLAEVEPKILNQELLYTGDNNLDRRQYIKPKEVMEPGKRYSVRELMKRSIVYSDNNAAQMLADYYPTGFLDRIVEALGMQMKRLDGTLENPITPRIYANTFRVLYNSSYLTKEYSDDALKLFTQTEYRDGVLAKLPSNVVVAHKFAERQIVDPSTQQVTRRQLHECGIVYAHDFHSPYIFCIMTEGNNFNDLQNVLQEISETIYTTLNQ